MPRADGKKNLKAPIRSTEEARSLGTKGGKASGEARRKKKLMSQIYADFLIERFRLRDKETGEDIETTGESLVNRVVKKVLISGGSGAVSLMREIREATEGQKIAVSGDIDVISAEERKARIAALKAKLGK